MSAMHLMRPEWLWGLLALPVLAALWWRRRRGDAWRRVVDPHLLPHLLEGTGSRRITVAPWLSMLAVALAVLALAGPAWRQVPQPLWQPSAPLMVVLDLSPAMLADDLPPTRLARAREKLSTLLRTRQGGQVGLVVYAGDAFTVAPLTGDPANVAVFLDSLHPGVMPVDGQRADRGIAHAGRLLRQAGFEQGGILLVATSADRAAEQAAAAEQQRGYRVSVLGVGTGEGAPYRGADGQVRTSRLDATSLRSVASAGGGRYIALADDAGDLEALGVLDGRGGVAGERPASGEAMAWVDEGFWLLPPLMLLVLIGFRRGTALRLVVVGLGLGLALQATPAHAQQLWQRPDQARHRQIQQGAEAYRAGDFAAAADAWSGVDTATGHYNRGNALARSGQYPQALEAYDEALRLDPDLEDARVNRALVEEAMKDQDQQGGGGEPTPDPGQDDPPSDASQGGEADEGQPQPDPQGSGQSPEPSPQEAGQDGDGRPEQDPAATPSSADAQREADQAQRERMEQALAQDAAQDGGETEQGATADPETRAERERRIANEAWLRRVPDDPGGLLREKFRIEYERRRLHGQREE